MPSRAPLLALCALLALACTPDDTDDDSDGGPGGGGSGGNPPAGTPIDIDTLAPTYGAFVCDYIRDCGGAELGFNLFRLLLDAGGDCPAYFANVYRTQIARDEETAELRFDQAAFNRCRATALDTCIFADRIPDCEAAIRGRRAAGQPCTSDTICAPDLYCADDPLAEGECRRACAARRAPGEPCDDDGQCARDGDRAGLCLRGGDDNEGICATAAARGGATAGDPCGLLTDGDAYARVTCREGSYCDAEDDAGTCQPTPGPGEPCVDTDFPCEDGICINGVCLAIDIVNSAGGGCDPSQLQVCNPLQGLACVDATCVRSQGGPGQPCTDSDLGVACQDGLYCNADDLCAAALADGEPCDPDGPRRACQSGACNVDPMTGDGTCGPDTDPCL